MAGRYQTRTLGSVLDLNWQGHVKLGRLGDPVSLTLPTIDTQSVSFDPSQLLTNPWILGLGALGLFVLYEHTPTISRSGGSVRISRRKKKQVGASSTIALVLAAAFGAYLIASYSSGSASS